MVVCPLCEHQQAAGAECEVCGRPLAPPDPVAVVWEEVPGLETTALTDGRAELSVEPLPGLDGVSEGAALEGRREARTQEVTPGEQACWYCGHRQMRGVLCDRCGARISVPTRRDAAAPEPVRAACRSCGIPGFAGKRCPSCGGFLWGPPAP